MPHSTVKFLPPEMTIVVLDPGHDNENEEVPPAVGLEPAVPPVVVVVVGAHVVF